MRYGKIHIEDGNLSFTKHMMTNVLPCREVIWAYLHREGENPGTGRGKTARQMLSNYLVIVTKRRKYYRFDMTEKEATECMAVLKALNPELAVGAPKGSRLSLQSLPNTRDLGGMETRDGRHILPRKLLRSGDLYHTSLMDQRILAEDYHLKTVVDFRSQSERKSKPDAIFQGVEYYHIPMFDEMIAGITQEDGVIEFLLGYEGNAEAFMEEQYARFIRDPMTVKQFARFIDVLLHHEDGAALWHCTFGKDRAGVGTAILLCALGVPKGVVREDYMRTNAYLSQELEYVLRYMEANQLDSIKAVENITAFFKVKEDYLNSVFSAIYAEYGSMEGFFGKGLYLKPKMLETLRNKYLI